jgi:hypothetical protein
MQWVRYPRKSSVDNLNNVRREASRHCRNKKKEYLKDKIEELETHSKIKLVRNLYRGINDFKKGYQPRTNIVKDEIWLQTRTVFWLVGGIISLSCSVHMGLMIVGREKCTQQNY